MLYFFFFVLYGDHRDLHGLTHSFPPRRASDLASETRANSTIGIDGGMIGPITAVAAVSAAAKLGAYLPSFVIMFCIILPVPAASAMAEPDMPAKMTLWRMLT